MAEVADIDAAVRGAVRDGACHHGETDAAEEEELLAVEEAAKRGAAASKPGMQTQSACHN